MERERSLLRAVIRDDAGRRVDVQRFFSELSAPARSDELFAEHDVVASMAAEIRAHQSDDRPRSTGHSALRSVVRVAIVTGTIVITAGSSLALVGGLPAPARELAARAFGAMGVAPAPGRAVAAAPPLIPTSQPFPEGVDIDGHGALGLGIVTHFATDTGSNGDEGPDQSESPTDSDQPLANDVGQTAASGNAPNTEAPPANGSSEGQGNGNGNGEGQGNGNSEGQGSGNGNGEGQGNGNSARSDHRPAPGPGAS